MEEEFLDSIEEKVEPTGTSLYRDIISLKAKKFNRSPKKESPKKTSPSSSPKKKSVKSNPSSPESVFGSPVRRRHQSSPKDLINRLSAGARFYSMEEDDILECKVTPEGRPTSLTLIPGTPHT